MRLVVIFFFICLSNDCLKPSLGEQRPSSLDDGIHVMCGSVVGVLAIKATGLWMRPVLAMI
jgi:hypothetical protein